LYTLSLHDALPISGISEEHSASVGQLHMTLRPMKEGSLQLLFESPDLLAQGRLGDMELRRRPPEMQLFGDREEVAEVAQLHARTHIINVSTLQGKCIGHPAAPAGSWA